MSTSSLSILLPAKSNTGSKDKRGRSSPNKIKLVEEFIKLIHMDLVVIGKRNPFYQEFMQRHTTAIVTPESWATIQRFIFGDFIKNQGDVSLLRNLWARISSFTNYHATVSDFDWREERLTVSIFF